MQYFSSFSKSIKPKTRQASIIFRSMGETWLIYTHLHIAERNVYLSSSPFPLNGISMLTIASEVLIVLNGGVLAEELTRAGCNPRTTYLSVTPLWPVAEQDSLITTVQQRGYSNRAREPTHYTCPQCHFAANYG